MNRSVKTMYAPAETDTTETLLDEVCEQFDRATVRRCAEYVIAVERVAGACREKGWV